MFGVGGKWRSTNFLIWANIYKYALRVQGLNANFQESWPITTALPALVWAHKSQNVIRDVTVICATPQVPQPVM